MSSGYCGAPAILPLQPSVPKPPPDFPQPPCDCPQPKQKTHSHTDGYSVDLYQPTGSHRQICDLVRRIRSDPVEDDEVSDKLDEYMAAESVLKDLEVMLNCQTTQIEKELSRVEAQYEDVRDMLGAMRKQIDELTKRRIKQEKAQRQEKERAQKIEEYETAIRSFLASHEFSQEEKQQLLRQMADRADQKARPISSQNQQPQAKPQHIGISSQLQAKSDESETKPEQPVEKPEGSGLKLEEHVEKLEGSELKLEQGQQPQPKPEDCEEELQSLNFDSVE